ncbi:MAG: carboxymuconolactone decarboxylase family protein [Gemmatimonadales bacterium]
MRLERLDEPTRALVALAAVIATGRKEAIESGCRAVIAAGTPARWVEEVLLQSVLMVGWPRALVAAEVWRRVHGPAAEETAPAGGTGTARGGPDADYDRHAEWRERGEAICRLIYGPNYARLRENVRALHPALDGWMVTEGYGRTIGREGLDLARRELCIVAQVAVLGAERQLHSHLRGAGNAGAGAAAIDEALGAAAECSGGEEKELASALWRRVRA